MQIETSISRQDTCFDYSKSVKSNIVFSFVESFKKSSQMRVLNIFKSSLNKIRVTYFKEVYFRVNIFNAARRQSRYPCGLLKACTYTSILGIFGMSQAYRPSRKGIELHSDHLVLSSEIKLKYCKDVHIELTA